MSRNDEFYKYERLVPPTAGSHCREQRIGGGNRMMAMFTVGLDTTRQSSLYSYNICKQFYQ